MGWKSKETDEFIDLALEGKGPEELSRYFGVSPEEVGAHFMRTFYPSKPYIPWGRRRSRTGQKMTALELKIIRRHHDKGIPTAHTARILQRKPNEICPDYYGKITFNQMKCLAPVSDQLLAHHYLYHVNKHPIITDQAYDTEKEEELEFGGGGPLLKAIAATKKDVADYPPHIRSLAYYMLYKFMQVTGEWNDRIVPYGWTKEERHWKK